MTHTAETLAAHILAQPDTVDLLIYAVDCAQTGFFGRKKKVENIIADAVAEIEAEGGAVPSDAVIECAWGLLDDAAVELLEARNAEAESYAASLYRSEYASERSGAWNSL